ncbi:MAG TPA: hypothetical protein VI685_08220 [Candidatus Angelobacter sp.]
MLDFVVKHRRSSLRLFLARQSGALSLVVTAVVTALGFFLNVLLLREGIPRKDLILLSSLVTGLVAGWLFYQFLRNERARQEAVQQRIHTVAELNHHIRNALQVIRYAGGAKSTSDATQLQLINEAVARIDWALREVLSRYPHGENGDGNKSGANVPRFSSAVVDDFVLRHKEPRTL